VSKKGKPVSFVCCEFVTLESSDEEDNSEINLTPEKKTSITGKTQTGSSPPAGNKQVNYKPSPLSKKQSAIKSIPLMAEKEGYEESVTNIPIQRETSINILDKITELPPEAEPKKVTTPVKKRPNVEDDSDSDIDIIMSPTARTKKTSPAEKNASKSPTMKTSPKHWMTEIPNMSPDDKQATKRRIFSNFADVQQKKQKLPQATQKMSALKEVEEIILLD
jgi:hypothetical protein